MAADDNNRKKFLSYLTVLLKLFDSMIEKCYEQRKHILTKNYEGLVQIVYQIEEDMKFINEIDSKLETYSVIPDFSNYMNDSEVILFKLQIREKIDKYREVETLNAKLMRDIMNFNKEKIKALLNTDIVESNTYDNKLKNKEEKIWNDTPVVFDNFI